MLCDGYFRFATTITVASRVRGGNWELTLDHLTFNCSRIKKKSLLIRNKLLMRYHIRCVKLIYHWNLQMK